MNILPINDAPKALSGNLFTIEDKAVDLTLGAQDIDGDELTYEIVTFPENGDVVGESDQWTYIPNPNFYGSDRITFRVRDGSVYSDTALVQIVIGGVNDPPIADDLVFDAIEDSPLSVVISGRDTEGSVLSYNLVKLPTKGVLRGAEDQWVYIPNSDVNGNDLFTYTVFDGEINSDEATVNIAIAAVNDPPIGGDLVFDGDEDEIVLVEVVASDVDSDGLTYVVTNPPQHGVLAGDGPDWQYVPNANFSGGDSFAYTVSDGLLVTQPLIVSINVASVNDQPQAQTISVSMDEDTSRLIELYGIDADGDLLEYFIVSPPERGVLTVDGHFVTYTPQANYNGADVFVYQVSDGELLSDPEQVVLQINPVDDSVRAVDQEVIINEDSVKSITLFGESPDAGDLTYQVVKPPTHGLLSEEAPDLVYTVNPNYNGEDLIVFKVFQNGVPSPDGFVRLTILPVNDAPEAFNSKVNTVEDQSVEVVLGGVDVDGDVLSYDLVALPQNGVIEGAGNQWTYTPNENVNGNDQFSFSVTDGFVDSPSALVEIQIAAVNDPPLAANLFFDVEEDASFTGVLPVIDVDGDPLLYKVVQLPSKGVVNMEAGQFVYTPNPDANGDDYFTYSVFDGRSLSSEATVSFTINPINDPPFGVDVIVDGEEDSSLAITGLANDVDSAILSYLLVNEPLHGVVTIGENGIQYNPHKDFFGADSFSVFASDGLLLSNPIKITLNITPVNDVPEALDLFLQVKAGQPAAFNFVGEDVDGDVLYYELIDKPQFGG